MHTPTIPCPTCDGTGAGPWEDEEEFGHCNQDESATCDTCAGSGQYPCTRCNGTHQHTCPDCHGRSESCTTCVSGMVICSDCDATGVDRCQDCDGNGWLAERCNACEEDIPHLGTMYVHDGEILCPDCFRVRCPPPACKACLGTGTTTLPPEVDVHGIVRARLGNGMSCSCCGGVAHQVGDKREFRNSWNSPDTHDTAWYVYRGGMCDSDGVYFARLCGDEQGLNGCLEDIVHNQDDVAHDIKEAIATARSLMPTEEDDGVIAFLQDHVPGITR